jgi:hypothetical protein
VPYEPKPIDTSKVRMPEDLLELRETLARNTHELWARKRMTQGWRPGPRRDDLQRTHPNLVTYDELPESERDYDRATAMEALKVIMALGYEIRKPARG